MSSPRAIVSQRVRDQARAASSLSPGTMGASLLAVWLSVAPAAAAPRADAMQAHYGRIAEASYGDALAAAQDLNRRIHTFLAQPSAAGLEEAKKAWILAREWYGQTEAFRFYGGPIDGEDGPERRVNAWPIDEAYLDYVDGSPGGGVINDPRLALSRETLVGLNEKNGEENVSTGWHAIEFLLWGQDQDELGPGQRPITDFVDGKGANAARRRAYLGMIADQLVDDLAKVAAAWAPGTDNYRARFAVDREGAKKILTGLGVLTRGELAGERLEVPMESQSQEDEHSCFSDNTHRDIVANTRGIQNIWEGRYQRADGTVLAGPGFKDVVGRKAPKIAAALGARIRASVAAAEALQPPFDREIKAGAPGRRRVQAVIDALKAQAKELVAAADALGIKRLATQQR